MAEKDQPKQPTHRAYSVIRREGHDDDGDGERAENKVDDIATAHVVSLKMSL